MEGKKLFRNTVKIGVDFGFAKVKHAAGHDKNGKCETKARTLSVVCSARGFKWCVKTVVIYGGVERCCREARLSKVSYVNIPTILRKVAIGTRTIAHLTGLRKIL